MTNTIKEQQNQKQSFVKDIGIEYSPSSTQIVSKVVFDFFKSSTTKIFDIDWKLPVCKLYSYLRDTLAAFAQSIITALKKKDSEATAEPIKQADPITPQIPAEDQIVETSVLSKSLSPEEKAKEAEVLDLFITSNPIKKTSEKANSRDGDLTVYVDKYFDKDKGAEISYKTMTRNNGIEVHKPTVEVPPIPPAKSKLPANSETGTPPLSPIFKEPLSMPFIVGNPTGVNPPSSPISKPETSLPIAARSPLSPFSMASASMQLKMGIPLGVKPTWSSNSIPQNQALTDQVAKEKTKMEEVD